MKNILTKIGILLLIIFVGCKEDWNDHYINNQPVTVNQNVWEAIKENSELSEFVKLVEECKLDTLFQVDSVSRYSSVYTLFIPNNDAINAIKESKSINNEVLAYHISKFFILPGNISGKKKIQTLMDKFSLFENNGTDYSFDGISLGFESPLYINGRFFIMDEVAFPKPNIYEFIALNNTAFKLFIDSQDTVGLDLEKSKVIGYDEQNRTIYDSVLNKGNLFEEEYFKVRTEYRSSTATFVFPTQEKYDNALNGMAQTLGAPYADYSNIPINWQVDVLMPYLVERGVFENMREPEFFDADSVLNILGDSIRIGYVPTSKTICSNGYAYDYLDFSIPDSLYMNPLRNEGEVLGIPAGVGTYNWTTDEKYGVTVNDNSIRPILTRVPLMSNDTVLSVMYPSGYSGNFELKYKVKSLFPRRYLMVVKTHMYIGGIYDIYVNDESTPVTTFDWNSYNLSQGVIKSVTSTKTKSYRYSATSGSAYNRFDCWVDNIKEYGDVTVKFVYRGAGKTKTPGLVIDYIDFVPEAKAIEYVSGKEKIKIY